MILESRNSDTNKLVGAIVAQWSITISAKMQKILAKYGDDIAPKRIPPLEPFYLTQLPKRVVSTFEPRTQQFIHTMGNMRIAFCDPNAINAGATFFLPVSSDDSGSILIALDPYELKWLLQSEATLDAVDDLFSSKKSSIAHELTHAYDWWASEGKFVSSKRSQQGLTAQDETNQQIQRDSYASYLNSPHEINARFAQAVHDNNANAPWKLYSKQVIQDFIGWEIIPESEQQQLIRRLWKFWNEHRSTHKTTDVSTYLQKISQAIEKTSGVKFELTDERDQIRVKVVGKVTPTLLTAVFNKLFKIGDAYRKSIVTSTLAGTMAKGLGFKVNKDFSSGGEKFVRTFLTR